MDEIIMRAVAGQFAIDGELTSFRRYGSGNVNSTFTFSTDRGKKYILQRINTNVFPKPYVLLHVFRFRIRIHKHFPHHRP